jgi:hypothetical protein
MPRRPVAKHARRYVKHEKKSQPTQQAFRWAWGQISTVISSASYLLYLDGDMTQELTCYAGSHLPPLNVGDVAHCIVWESQVHILTTYPQS